MIRFAIPLVLVFAGLASAAETPADRKCYDAAARWLIKQQHDNGGFGELRGQKGEVGITAIVVKALAQAPQRLREELAPTLSKATSFLVGTQQEDGSFVLGRAGIPAYRTSVVIMGLCAVDKQKHAAAIEKAVAYLKGAQIDEAEGFKSDDVRYGGFSYGPVKGGRGRRGGPSADLSNTAMALAALHEAGVAKDDPVFKRAMTFLRRCQNNSETNDGAGFTPKDDGGFVYNPVAGGKQAPDSYAGMTYSGLLSLVYAGASPEDPTVKAATSWIAQNYTLEENRGLGARGSRHGKQAGLYYYYFSFAKCLQHLGQPKLETAKGEQTWARDLFDVLRARQREDGSFKNADQTWWEGNPVLATAYCLNAMNHARGHLDVEEK